MRRAEAMSSQETQGSPGHRISAASRRMEDDSGVQQVENVIAKLSLLCESQPGRRRPVEDHQLERKSLQYHLCLDFTSIACVMHVDQEGCGGCASTQTHTAFSQSDRTKLGGLILPRQKVIITFSLSGLLLPEVAKPREDTSA